MRSSPEGFFVLVVDDDRMILRTLEDVLRLRGYETLTAPSAAQGLELTRRAPVAPGVALVDVGLPDMDGLELVTALRRIAPETEVVVLTGNATVDSAIRALRESSYDYLIKPVHPEQLLSSIERARERWQRRRAEAAMQASEDRLRRIFEHVSDALLITDEHGTITDANRAAAELTGCTIAELCAGDRTIANLLGMHHEPGRSQPDEPGSTDVRDWATKAAEQRIVHADGHVQVVDVRAATFAPGRMVYTVRDLTHERRLEEQLHQAQKMEAIGRLAGGVAHDFNNVLTTISCVSQLVLDTLEPTDDRRADLQEILTASRRAAGLTRQLLAFSRKQLLQPRVLDLTDVIYGMERMLRRLIGEDIRLTTSIDPSLWMVRADPGQLEQVIMNLAVNARDAMPAGGQLALAATNVRVEESPAHANGEVPAGDYVVIQVTDTGCGIDTATRERMFEPFFTTKPPGKGTGLGLATVYGIVQQSGGHLRVESVVGSGTTFHIYLPRVREAARSDPSESSLPAMSRRRAVVLLVEDDAAIRSLAHRILAANGYTVLDAPTGERALALAEARDQHIDLLLTDVVLSGLNGRDLADRIRVMHPGVRVLFMSGYTDDEVVHRGVMDPAGGLLTKPFAATELVVKVRDVLSRGDAVR